MESEEILRPTPERLRQADHLADDGAPTQKMPYIRAQRLGTAWDRYCRDRDKDNHLLTDSQMTLTRQQISTGTQYIEAYEGSTWGYPGGSKTEPGISSSFKGVPAGCLDKAKKVRALEAKLSPRYLVSLIQAVLIEGYSAETWADATNRKTNSGIHYLRLALDQMGE